MRKIAFISGLLVALFVSSSPARAAGSWTWPVRGPVLTAFHNGDDPYAAGQHRGIDIGAAVGTPVVAATAGSVVSAGVVGSSGLTVSERSADGRYELSYLHLSSIAVRAGAHVSAGDRLGAVGTSGDRSTEAPHLHFGVRDADSRTTYHDPLDFLAPLPVDQPGARPAPAPSPATEPARPSAAPRAVHLPALAPIVHPLRVLRGVGRPGARPAPAHGPHSAARPVPFAHAVPALGRAPLRSNRTAHATQHSAHHAPVHAHAQAPGQAPSLDPLGDAPASPAAASRPPTAEPHPVAVAKRSTAGIDLGWLAACIGLVVAATLLANPSRARRAARHSRASVDALLRPLMRRS